MEKLKFIVEKNTDGYWAHHVEPGAVIGGYGETLTELKADVVNAYSLLHEGKKLSENKLFSSLTSPLFLNFTAELSRPRA